MVTKTTTGYYNNAKNKAVGCLRASNFSGCIHTLLIAKFLGDRQAS
jgi:hypothetical protein